MTKRRISLHELMQLMSMGPVELNVSRCLEEAGTGKIHVGLEVHVAVMQPCDEIEIELKLVEENPDEELDVEDVGNDGGVLCHLPSSSHLSGDWDHDS